MSAQHKKHSEESASVALEQIQGTSDRVAEWISENPLPILGSMGVVLVIAAIWGLVGSAQETAVSEAANSLAVADREYRRAMGASPGSVEIPEPANPEAARSARTDAIEAYGVVIEEHSGSPAAAVAAIYKGQLQQDLGQAEAALASLEAGADSADGTLRALLLARVAALHEEAGRAGEAADRYEQAAAIETYPLRHQALAEAARNRAQAGEAEAAVALLQRLEAEAPTLQLPPHVSARLNELRALSSQ